MKPILFNTDIVRAILEGRKTVTRRVVKLANSCWNLDGLELDVAMAKVRKDGTEHLVDMTGLWAVFEDTDGLIEYPMIKAPYCPGEILYVRETFRIDYLSNIPGTGHIHYKADGSYSDFSFMPERYEMMRRAQLKPGWRPNENMPREAARIFLRVTDVRVERLQNITEAGAVKEGFEAILCNHPGGYPCTDCMNTGYLEPAMLGFVDTWNSTIKPSDRAIYGWDANPWVWVIQFERCERPKEVCPHGGAGEGGRLT